MRSLFSSAAIVAPLICMVLVCAPGVNAAPTERPLQFEAPESLLPLADQLRQTQERTMDAALAATGLSRPGDPIRVLLSPEEIGRAHV